MDDSSLLFTVLAGVFTGVAVYRRSQKTIEELLKVWPERDWKSQWHVGRTPFHMEKVNPDLKRYIENFGPSYPGNAKTILVPCCGKSLDVKFLLQKGYHVVGVEIVDKALA